MSKSENQPSSGMWLASLVDPGQIETKEPGTSRKGLSCKTIISAGGMRALFLLGELGCSLPISARSESCGVIFDGVLYNRKELSQHFGGSSLPVANDADLVLHAYKRWGEEVLYKIKGIFALIIWDSRSNILLCARDPLGIYPLFYADTERELLLSTSIETLVQHPRISSKINRLVLAEHLCHRWLNTEETFYASVRRLPPGHALRESGSGRRIYRYWKPTSSDSGFDWIRENEIERFYKLLEQAVNRCLKLGKAGIFLSGGLDSVSVATVAVDITRRKGMADPWALSLVYPHPEWNEEAIQKGVADDLGLPRVMVSFDEAVGSKRWFHGMLEMSSSWPVPLFNIWLPALSYLGMEGKRHGCQVILTGGGGDEWLAVSPILAADLIRALDIRGLYLLWNSINSSYQIPPLKILLNMLWRSGLQPLLRTSAKRILLSVAPGFLNTLKCRHISKSMPNWIAPDTALKREIKQRAEESRGISERGSFYLQRMRHTLDNPLKAMVMEENFELGRHMGMRILQPFFDAELVDLLYRTPPEFLNRGARSKGLVREMLAQRFPVLGFKQQKKVVNDNFFWSLMMREMPIAWQTMGATPSLAQLDIVDKNKFNSAITSILSGKKHLDIYQILTVLNVEAWLRTHQ